MNKQDNRQRWPDLAKAVDNLRAVFGEVSVMNIYEHGNLVMGKPIYGHLIQPHVDGLPERPDDGPQRPYRGRRSHDLFK